MKVRNPLDGVSELAGCIQIDRQRLLDGVEIARQLLLSRRVAFDRRALGGHLGLGLDDLRLLRGDRLGEVVARQRARGDSRLQLGPVLFVAVEISFKQVLLELRLGVNEGRIRSRMTAVKGLGAPAQRREFGFQFFHVRFFSKEGCHGRQSTAWRMLGERPDL